MLAFFVISLSSLGVQYVISSGFTRGSISCFLGVHHAPPCQNLISFRLPKMANTSLFLLIQPSLNLIIFIHLTFRIIQRSDIRRFEKSKNVPYFCTLSTLWMLDGTSFLAPNRSAFICFVKRTFVVFVRFGNYQSTSPR